MALFSLGLPLTYAAFLLSGYTAPANLAEILATAMAILGLLLEFVRDKQKSVWPLWLTTGIPALCICWISFSSFEPLIRPLLDHLPLLMESRPLIFLLVSALWITIFAPPSPKQISFWSGWLSLLICIEFVCRFFIFHQPDTPGIFGLQNTTGPILLVGYCATLHNRDENRLTRMIILAGIFCSLGRDLMIAAVLTRLLFGPKGGLNKFLLVICMLFFAHLSLQVQEMTFIGRQDLPSYWLWFTLLDMLGNNLDHVLLTGFPLASPLSLDIPPSLWTIWHEQQHLMSGSEIYLFHVQPFWLHMLAAWGLPGPCFVAAVFAALYRRYPSDMMGGLITIVTIAGFLSPLFFSPASALILFIAFIAATVPEVQSFRFE